MRRCAPPFLCYVLAPSRYAFGVQRKPLLELLKGLEFCVAWAVGLFGRHLDCPPQRSGLGCVPERSQALKLLDGVQVQRVR